MTRKRRPAPRRKTRARPLRPASRPAGRTAIPRLFLTPGEPAGIGPDLALVLARQRLPGELVVVADPELLRERARRLGLKVALEEFQPDARAARHRPGRLLVSPVSMRTAARPGRLNPVNASYVLDTLRQAVALCERDGAAAVVTGPVHKGVINDAGIAFTGHTEFLAQLTGVVTPVMMLVGGAHGPDRGHGPLPHPLRVALATTHLALRDVPDAITADGLKAVLRVLAGDLRRRFGIARPRVLVAGLNPHAGEQGHLGREEVETIEPVLAELRAEGLDLVGPLPADTLFASAQLAHADAVLAMYHDQGLPVLKYAGFGHAVNVTLGLPIVRTSVDHGTALDLAGTGRADAGSLRAALALAAKLARPTPSIASIGSASIGSDAIEPSKRVRRH